MDTEESNSGLYEMVCNRCDLVLAPSEGMQQMIKGYGVNTPIAVFPTGLDESFFRKNAGRAQEIRETCSRGKRHLLVTVSRLEKEKNYGFLLRGIAELERKMGDDFHVLIIGDGSQKAELKVRASILGIRDKVTFVGNIPNDQVKDYLNAADLFLFASKSRPRGLCSQRRLQREYRSWRCMRWDRMTLSGMEKTDF